MMLFKTLFHLIFLFCLINHKAYGEVINKVVLTGNTKTKKKSLMKWGGIKVGKEISADDLDQILEKLKRAYQFNLNKIYFDKGTLYIDIEDKWSIFPIPSLTQSGNYYSRGILIYENNFLGRLGTLVPAVFWTNSGLNGFFYFQEDSLLNEKIGIKILFLHKADLTEFKRKDRVVDTFETRFDTVLLTPNYHNGRNDHKLGPIFIKKKVYKVNENKVFSAEKIGIYYRHHYNRFKKLPVLFEGLVTTFDLFLLPSAHQDYSYLTSADAVYCWPNYSNFLKAQVHFHYTNNSGYLSPKMLGGNEGYRGYDRNSLAVQRNIGFMLQEQFKMIKRTYFSVFYEFNRFKLIQPVFHQNHNFNESTVGINFSYYFKKISIPAIILDFARNINDKSNHLHINIGLAI